MNKRIVVMSIFVVLFVIPLFTVGLLTMFTDVPKGALMVVCATAVMIVMIAMREREIKQ